MRKEVGTCATAKMQPTLLTEHKEAFAQLNKNYRLFFTFLLKLSNLKKKRMKNKKTAL